MIPATQDRVKFSIGNLLKEDEGSLNKFTETAHYSHILQNFNANKVTTESLF